MPGLGVFCETLMEIEGRNRTTNPRAEYQWVYVTLLGEGNGIRRGEKRNIRKKSKGGVK